MLFWLLSSAQRNSINIPVKNNRFDIIVLSDPPRLDPASILPYLLPKFFFWYLRGGTTRWLQSGGSHGPYTRHSGRSNRPTGSNDHPES